MKRWVGIAALGLAAASGIVTQGAAAASGSVYQTAAISKNDIWAVGPTYTRAGKTIYRPFIRHFNGRSWQVITIPHASSSTRAFPRQRRMTSGCQVTRSRARSGWWPLTAGTAGPGTG